MECKKCGKVNGLKIGIKGQPLQCYSCYKIEQKFGKPKPMPRVRRILTMGEF